MSKTKDQPIFVYFSDNGEADIYKLTRSQFESLQEADDWATIDKFKITDTVPSHGYVPDYLMELAAIYGFEVDSI